MTSGAITIVAAGADGMVPKSVGSQTTHGAGTITWVDGEAESILASQLKLHWVQLETQFTRGDNV